MRDERNLVKQPYYSPWFSGRKRKIRFWQKRIPSERVSQDEQNGANFSFIAPSSEEFRVCKENHECMCYIQTH